MLKCPLIAIGYLASSRVDATEKCICGGEECARWDKEHGICGDLSKTKALWTIAETLCSIELRMPHEAQFRK